MRQLISIVFLLMLCSPAWAATYYIDYGAADDSANGTTTSTPWKRAPGMVGFAGSYSHSAGDVFVFKGGGTWPYTTLPLTIGYSGTEGNIDTYMGGQRCGQSGSAACNGGVAWGIGYPVFDGAMSLGLDGYGIYSYDKSYVLIDGIKVLDVGNSSSTCTAENVPADCCTGFGTGNCTDGKGTAIAFFNGDSIEAKNCWLQPEGLTGFGYANGSGAKSKVYFHDSYVRRAGRCIIYSDPGSTLDDVRIYDIDYQGPGDTYTAAFHLDGFMVGNPDTLQCTSSGTATVTNLLFARIKFYGDWSAGATALIYSNGCTNYTTVYNSQFYIEDNSGGPNISPGFINFHQHDGNISILSSAFSSDAYPGYNLGAKGAIEIDNSPGPIVIKGNIFSGFGIALLWDTSQSPTVTVDYNLYNMSHGGDRVDWGYVDASQIQSWADWQAAGYDTHGVNNPACASMASCTYSGAYVGFIAVPTSTVGSGDLRIGANSPAKDAFPTAQAPTGIFTTDYSGVNRPQGAAWDIGAYEYYEQGSIRGVTSMGVSKK